MSKKYLPIKSQYIHYIHTNKTSWTHSTTRNQISIGSHYKNVPFSRAEFRAFISGAERAGSAAFFFNLMMHDLLYRVSRHSPTPAGQQKLFLTLWGRNHSRYLFKGRFSFQRCIQYKLDDKRHRDFKMRFEKSEKWSGGKRGWGGNPAGSHCFGRIRSGL